MRPRPRGPAGVVTVILGIFLSGVLSPAVGQESLAREPVEGAPESLDSPMAVFAALERFWSDDAGDSLIARVCPDRIRLSFRRIGPRDGTFERAQAEYLLADLFSFTRTDSFFFVEYEYDPTEDAPPRAVGRWFFKGEAAVEREARVTIRLTPHAGTWAISSIEAKKW
jgi:hypothetical protein